MSHVDVVMPKMGESVHEALIIKWVKSVGDKIDADETLLEIATDKVDSEIPSPASGKIAKILFKDGETVKVGTLIAVIDTNSKSVSTGETYIHKETVPHAELISPAEGSQPVKPVNAPYLQKSPVFSTTGSFVTSLKERFYSPLVKNIAKSHSITKEELSVIPGTGKNDRVTKHDILAYVFNKPVHVSTPVEQKTVSIPLAETQPIALRDTQPSLAIKGNVEIIEMNRMRKLIADHMVMSKHTSPHVTSFVEADVTNIVMWREKVKNNFENQTGEKITYTPIFIESVVAALKDFPMVNVSVDGTKIIVKKYINIGMATALPSGNLIVPVIKNADYLNLLGITKVVNDLATRARNNQLKPDETQEGTFTITNVGTFGNLMGTPIINQPQVAILATGAIKKKPAVIETEEGDSIGIRHMMFLSLSYDHRVVDGYLGGRFLRKVADYLEQFDIKRSI